MDLIISIPTSAVRLAEIAYVLLAGSRGCAGSGGRAKRQSSTIRRELDGTEC